jgi:uncharacterized protein (DUF488 family)
VVAKKIFTIGYEGAELADFLATLIACGISQIVDVRDIPLSRKKGFSKSVLSEALRKKDIEYLHIRGLGDPKAGREAARRGEFALFRKIYNQHLKTEAAQLALEEARKAASNRISCLLCFERSNENCHRSIIATRLSETSQFTIRHIGIRVGAAKHRKAVYGQAPIEFALR